MFRVFWLFVLSFFATFWRRWRRGPLRPTWSFRFEVVVGLMRRLFRRMEDWPVSRIRAQIDALPTVARALSRTRRESVPLGEVPGLWLAVDGAPEDRVMLYVHGGAFLFGSARLCADVMARIALASGVDVVGIDYRLAPENPYPAALDDTEAAFQALVERGVPAENIVLAGDSAGANLCIALCVRLREAGRALPGGAVLFSPWVDLAATRPSMERNQDYDYGTREMLRDQAALYAQDIPLSDARISPINQKLDGLPPLLVQYGGAELLEDECRDFCDRARAAGVDVTTHVLVDMPHNGQAFADYAPAGARAIERAAGFVRERLALDSRAGAGAPPE